MKIKDTPKIDRPQEKLVKYGPEKLTDVELLAIILRTGTSGQNVIELSSKIIRKFGKDFGMLSVKDLSGVRGLGGVKAAQLVSSFELSKRFLQKEIKRQITPEIIFETLIDTRVSKKEHFIVFYLNSRNQEIHREIVSVGTLDSNLIHPREVFEPAIKNLACNIIIVHNHPSGLVNPSESDIKITQQLIEAGKILGIRVLDHVIIAQDCFLSFKEKGLLNDE